MPISSSHPLRNLSPRTVGLAAAVVTVLIWSAFIVIARASADPARGGTMSPFDIGFSRIVGASLVLMPGSLPLWTALLAALVLRDRITPWRALGLGLIVLGDVMVGGASLLRAFEGGDVWKGDLLFMSTAFCWATYSVLARRHRLDAVRATIAVTAFALITYVPAYLLLGWLQLVPVRLFTAPLGEVLFQLGFQGWGSVVMSGIAFTKMIQHFGPVRSTMITALVPGLSALGAVVFLGEPLNWGLAAGLALVTLGILFGVRAAAPVATELKSSVQ